jgi:hypothetical protein
MATGIRKVEDDNGNVYETEWYREEVAKAERGNRAHLAKHDRSFSAVLARMEMAKADDADGDENDRNRNDGGNASVHPAVQIATLLVASGKFPGHAQALDHLLNTSRGQALLQRMHKTEKETSMDNLENILKDYGPIKLCKSIVDRGRSPCGEHELVAALTKAASEQHPQLSPAQAFAELYKTEAVWRAIGIAKAMPFQVSLEPLQVGGESAQAVNDPSDAIAQLKQLGARKWPTASESDQFERALTDPVNHKLARLAVPIPAASTSYPFPR